MNWFRARRALYIAAALVNLVVFVLGGFDVDKLIIAGLFVVIMASETAVRRWRGLCDMQNALIDDLIGARR